MINAVPGDRNDGHVREDSSKWIPTQFTSSSKCASGINPRISAAMHTQHPLGARSSQGARSPAQCSSQAHPDFCIPDTRHPPLHPSIYPSIQLVNQEIKVLSK